MSNTQRRTSWWSEDQWKRFEDLLLREALEDIKAVTRTHFPTTDVTLLDRAMELAEEKHGERTQSSTGRLEIRHVLAVARTVAELGLDLWSVAAALLHDVIEDGRLSPGKLEGRFGHHVARWVGAVSRCQTTTKDESEAGIQRQVSGKVPSAFAGSLDDLPPVFIKLAERLDHMRFSAPQLPLAQRQDVAREVMQAYAPLAERLGAWELKAQLEDLAFKYLDPKGFQWVANQLEAQASDRSSFLSKAVHALKQELPKGGIEATVESRTKHIYSAYDKMRRTGRTLAEIQDLVGLRIILGQEFDCFRVLGLVHSLWNPLLEEFDDYINTPKPNGYRSLHTAVMSPAGFALEVQIRTWEMHEVAEFGRAAHWRYSIERGNWAPDSLTYRNAHDGVNRFAPGGEHILQPNKEMFNHESGQNRCNEWISS